ncbi:hypothetical protein [Nocardia crassostreae]|uniref:hypothetical protein n=1 Tax=Nocardia crassostreae TaxID=53428 RepID=UPI0012F82290|nr:hypothetical protein [Nocardia crassostreae]
MADAGRVRAIGAAVGEGDVEATRDREGLLGLTIREVGDAAVAVAAAREALSGEAARVEVFADGRPSNWRVDFPFTAEDQRRVLEQVDRLPARSAAWLVGAQGDHLTELAIEVGVEDPYREIAAAIEALALDPDRPLLLYWTGGGGFGATGTGFQGSADIGGCRGGYGIGIPSPDGFFYGVDQALQERVRAEYDACSR